MAAITQHVRSQGISQPDLKQTKTGGFWAQLLQSNSEGKVKRLLNLWLQESHADYPSALDRIDHVSGDAVSKGECLSLARRHSAPEDTPHKLDLVHPSGDVVMEGKPSPGSVMMRELHGVPRKTSPADVMTYALQVAATSGAPPLLEPSGSTEDTTSTAAPSLPDVGETPTTSTVIPEAPRPAGKWGRLECCLQPSRAAPPRSPSRVSACVECDVAITGAVFMLNDHAYCCQRHRLLAYHKVERDQINSRSISSPRPSHEGEGMGTTGLASMYRAWI